MVPVGRARRRNVKTLINNGSSDNRVDIVVVGDGYRNAELDTFRTHVNNFFDYFSSGGSLAQPFHRYRNFFNLHVVDVSSSQSGADDPNSGKSVDTALDASYLGDGVTDRLLTIDSGKAETIVNNALNGSGFNPEMRVALVNSSKYGGSGGLYAVGAGDNAYSWEIILHELGHSFAQLADEYVYYPEVTYTGSEPSAVNLTIDPNGAKWSAWLGYKQPGIGVIGVYEGGAYGEYDLYRPSMDSKMRSLSKPFDAVAREAIIHQIYSHVDPIDSTSVPGGTKQNLNRLRANVVDPKVVDLDWRINGRLVDAGSILRLSQFVTPTFGADIKVKATARDATRWVRTDKHLVRQNVTWTIRLRADGATAGNDVQKGNNGHNVIFGLAGDDELLGKGGDDWLIGGSNKDRLLGGKGTDALHGGSGRDTLVGGAGADVLYGDALDSAIDDVDRLTGGTGKDTFVLTSAASKKRDLIRDFKSGKDQLQIARKEFGFKPSQKFGSKNFLRGSFSSQKTLRKAMDRNDLFVFNTKSGQLYFDKNGNKSGGGFREVVKLQGGADLKFKDLLFTA